MKVMLSAFGLLFTSIILAQEPSSCRPTLNSCEIEGNRVSFLLDNGWVASSEVPLFQIYKLDALSRFEGAKVCFETFPQIDSILMRLENPAHPNYPKITFPISLRREDYQNLPTVVEMSVVNWLITWSGSITLSDGSQWRILKELPCMLADRYWSVGDRIIASEKISDRNTFSLVNLDVSGEHWIDYYRGPGGGEVWFSLRDPRTIEVCKK